MKFYITRTSVANYNPIKERIKEDLSITINGGDTPTVEFKTLEELMIFCEEVKQKEKHSIVIDAGEDIPIIEIYDTYRE